MRRRGLLLSLLLLAAAARAEAKVLPLDEVTQEQLYWCWAGVSQAVLRYYGHDVPQCTIAELTRKQSTHPTIDYGAVDCCVDAGKGCNNSNFLWEHGGSIKDILKHLGGVDGVSVEGSLTRAQLETEVDTHGRPVVILWTKHFVVIHGIKDELVNIMDPNPGEGLKVVKHSWILKGEGHTWLRSLRLTTSCRCTAKSSCCDGCQPVKTAGACDDGSPCTVGDTCVEGSCRGQPACPVTDYCQVTSTCDSKTGACAFVNRPDGTSCDDRDPCTKDDVCAAGACKGTPGACPPAADGGTTGEEPDEPGGCSVGARARAPALMLPLLLLALGLRRRSWLAALLLLGLTACSDGEPGPAADASADQQAADGPRTHDLGLRRWQTWVIEAADPGVLKAVSGVKACVKDQPLPCFASSGAGLLEIFGIDPGRDASVVATRSGYIPAAVPLAARAPRWPNVLRLFAATQLPQVAAAAGTARKPGTGLALIAFVPAASGAGITLSVAGDKGHVCYFPQAGSLPDGSLTATTSRGLAMALNLAAGQHTVRWTAPQGLSCQVHHGTPGSAADEVQLAILADTLTTLTVWCE